MARTRGEDGPYPSQPFAFLAWLAERLASPDAPCTAAMFGRSGALILFGADSTERLLWAPAWAVPQGSGFTREALGGTFLPEGMPDAAAFALAARLEEVVLRHRPIRLAWGPGTQEGPVRLVTGDFGGLLRRHMEPGRTAWGPYVFDGFRQEGPFGVSLSFTDHATGARVGFIVSVPDRGSGPVQVYGRRDVTVRRTVDGRTPGLRRQTEHQVERLVGYALGRALGRDPVIEIHVPERSDARAAGGAGPMTESGPVTSQAPASGDAGPGASSLSQRIHRAAFPFELGPACFFRPWGGNFVSNELLLRSPGLGRLVCHSNRECQCGIPIVTGVESRYHASPWPRDAEDPAEVLLTDFDDESAVLGGMDRLHEAVRRAAAASAGGPVFVLQMCEYECLGDDVEAVAAAGRESTGATILTHENVVSEGPLAHLDNRWAPVLDLLLPRSGAGQDPAGVNLCGYVLPGAPARQELESLLAGCGVRVTGVLFPYLDRRDLGSLARASLWVTSPWDVVQKGLGAALERAGRRVACLTGPFGVEGSIRFVEAILRALGLPEPTRDAMEALVAAARDALEPLRLEAARFRAGIAVPAGCSSEVLSPSFFYGLDPVGFLGELGFDVAVVEVPDDDSAVEVLRGSGCHIVYSDWADDPRVEAAGAMTFDCRSFEPGPDGAVRTARRLLARCRGTFFRRYGGLIEGATP